MSLFAMQQCHQFYRTHFLHSDNKIDTDKKNQLQAENKAYMYFKKNDETLVQLLIEDKELLSTNSEYFKSFFSGRFPLHIVDRAQYPKMKIVSFHEHIGFTKEEYSLAIDACKKPVDKACFMKKTHDSYQSSYQFDRFIKLEEFLLDSKFLFEAEIRAFVETLSTTLRRKELSEEMKFNIKYSNFFQKYQKMLADMPTEKIDKMIGNIFQKMGLNDKNFSFQHAYQTVLHVIIKEKLKEISEKSENCEKLLFADFTSEEKGQLYAQLRARFVEEEKKEKPLFQWYTSDGFLKLFVENLPFIIA